MIAEKESNHHNNEDNKEEFDWILWYRFLKCDLSRYCCQIASNGDLMKLIVVLNRHCGELDKDPIGRSEKV